jgi:hypothetical protein
MRLRRTSYLMVGVVQMLSLRAAGFDRLLDLEFFAVGLIQVELEISLVHLESGMTRFHSFPQCSAYSFRLGALYLPRGLLIGHLLAGSRALESIRFLCSRGTQKVSLFFEALVPCLRCCRTLACELGLPWRGDSVSYLLEA